MPRYIATESILPGDEIAREPRQPDRGPADPLYCCRRVSAGANAEVIGTASAPAAPGQDIPLRQAAQHQGAGPRRRLVRPPYGRRTDL